MTQSPPPVDPRVLLTPCEVVIYDALLTSASEKEIARMLGRHIGTVKSHIGRMYVKLGYRGRLDLMARALAAR